MKKGRVMSIRVITLAGLLAVGPWVYGQTQMANVLTAQDAHEITQPVSYTHLRAHET